MCQTAMSSLRAMATFAYDAEGRLFKQTRTVNGRTFEQTVTAYDALDRPTKVKLPSGEVVITGYDEEGVNTLKAGSTTLISGVGYNERGQPALLQRPNPAPNTSWVYHGEGVNFRLNKILNGGEGTDALPDFIYGATGYDSVGNPGTMQVKLNSGSDTYSFSYDELNRLTTTNLLGGGAAEFIYTPTPMTGWGTSPAGRGATRT